MHATRTIPRNRVRRRRYDMSQRSRHAAATRAEILAAAHGLLDDRELGGMTVDDVARAAGVSRATVYNQFGSRQRLLAAVFEDQGRRIGYERVLAALRLPEPRTALIAVVRESCRAWSSSPLAIRRTLALAVIDPMIGGLVARYEGYRRAEFAGLAQALVRSAGPRTRIDPADAAAMLGALTSFQAFDLLLAETDANAAAERLVHMALTTFGLAPESRS